MLSYLWWYLLPSLPLVWPLPLIDKGESRLHSTKCLVNIFSQDKSALHCCRLKPGCPQADFCWWVVSHISSLILLEAGLYKLGSMRYMAEKTSTNVYRCFHQEKHLSFPSSRLPNLDKDVFFWSLRFSHFRDPCSQAPSMAEPPPTVLGERAFSGDSPPSFFFFQVKCFQATWRISTIFTRLSSTLAVQRSFTFLKTPMTGLFLWLIPKNLEKQVADQMSGNVYMHASVVEDECSKVSASWNRRTNQVLIDFSASAWLNKLASFP